MLLPVRRLLTGVAGAVPGVAGLWPFETKASRELARKQRALHAARLLQQAKAAEIDDDLTAAGAILDELVAQAPRDWKARCRRARLALKAKDLTQAKASAAVAAMLQPREPEPWVIMARVAEQQSLAKTLDLWMAAAERSDLEALLAAQAQQAERNRAAPSAQAQSSKPEPPMPQDRDAVLATASLEQVLERAQHLVRAKDMKALFALLDRFTPAAAEAPQFELARRYYGARVLFHHQCFEEVAEACRALLSDPPAVEFLGSGIPSRRFDLASIRARSLSILGRSREAQEIAETFADGSRESLALTVDVNWRPDPERALEAAAALLFGGDRRHRADVWFAFIPLTMNDTARARSHLTIEMLRRKERRRILDPELALCAALICGEDGDERRQVAFFRSYFDHYGLDFPQADLGPPFAFERFDLAVERQMTGPLVTVIMTAFNAESTIEYALASVVNQSHANLEIIVVDDCSSDGTWAKLTSYADRDRRIVALRNQDNVGTHECKNIALRIARGDYYTCHDSDDWCHPRRIEHHVACMEASPDLVASSSNWFRMDERGRPMIRPWHGKFTHLNPASIFYRMQVRSEIGFYDRVRIEADLEHWLRLGVKYGADRIARLELPLAIGRSHTASLTRSGAGAQNRDGYSATRSRYRRDALDWRRRMSLAGDLYLPSPLEQRPFPAPPKIEVGRSTVQTRYRAPASPEKAADVAVVGNG